jgi:hypothetical protein
MASTNDLRARLRARYQYFRTGIGDPELPSGYFRWLHSGLSEESRMVFAEGEPITGQSMMGMGGKADAMALEYLRAIAKDPEIGFVCQSLQLPPAFSLVRADMHYGRGEWAVAWPNGTTFPHHFERATMTLELVSSLLDAWIEHLAGSAPNDDGLIPEARAFLKAMLAYGFHDGNRGKQEDIWKGVGEIDEEKQGKTARAAALKLLKDRGLVDSRSGTGTTLTDAGLKLARGLR